MNLHNAIARGRILVGESVAGGEKVVRKDDPQDYIDICLTCDMPKCTGNCSRFPEATSTAGKARRSAIRARNEEIEADRIKTAQMVSAMLRNGASKPKIAWHLGLSIGEVNDSIRFAKSRGMIGVDKA